MRGGGVEGEQRVRGRAATRVRLRPSVGPPSAADRESAVSAEGPHVVVVRGSGTSSSRSIDERLGQALAPLHHGDRVDDVGVEVEVVELGGATEPVGVDVDRAAVRRPSDGCTREITKVGEVTSPRTPSPAPIPWVSVVLPAPRSPVRITRSPCAQQRGQPLAEGAGVLGGVQRRA